MNEKRDLHEDEESPSHTPPLQIAQQQEKVVPSADYIENYAGKAGFSHNLAAVAQAQGFKPEDGRLVVDPAEARIEYGEEIASKLKLNKSGTKVLWPQPSDSPDDPQNWSPRKKNIQLLILTMASFVPDFASGLGIAGLFGLAETFNTTTEEINNISSNWSIFCLGPGGIIAVMLIKRYGRLPILFWSQFIGLGFLIGCAVAPNLHTFAAMRILNALFSTAPQCAGLFTVCDLFPFHLQARKLNLWTMGFIISPFISPFLLGFMVASSTWRNVYWVGVAYVILVVVLIVLFMEETMYDRDVVPFPERPTQGLRYRIETLLGVTGVKMAKYRCSWAESVSSVFDLVWRPHMLLMLIYVGVTFGFGIGINVTTAVFTGSPPPVGYGFSAYGTAACYGIPIVAVIIGELVGRYLNDAVADRLIKRNSGVFLAEFRLWTCYVAIPFFVAGFVLIGAGFQYKLSVAALVFGWGMAEFAILINTVSVYNYLNNCFPTRQGEVSALVNFARTMGGFAVPYYQVPYAEKVGPLAVFGMEAGIAAGLFILIIPFLQLKGASLRHRFSIHHS
ncbi:major facilitator superfamily domain-containing protein [Leucosporidium creatinivorum]|uniref:Major facilitator superfamily domain-containing protein n=1 Tax=Leucosporidium creatinivorum TaxID=106004 RepID=A0A1Y2FXD5_9BASI|nr:major facilitator superfamily domain-containing protein [Leucosporidium creatinivorum]